MSVFQTAYCDYNFLSKIYDNIDNKLEDKIAYKIIVDYSNVIINLDESEFEDLIEDNEMLKRLLRREFGEIDFQKTYFKYFNEFDTNEFYTNHFNDFIFLNDSNYLKIRNLSGVNIYSYSELENFRLYNQNLRFSFKPTEESTFLNWEELFEKKTFLPINTLILVDNFLFKTETEFELFKFENLFTILKKVIPCNLDVPFEFLLVLDNRNGLINLNFCKKLKEEIFNYLGVNEGKLKIGIITTSLNPEIHQRVLISNNFYFWSDKGFNIVQNNTPVKSTNGEFSWNYESVTDCIGDIPKKGQLDYLREIFKQKAKNKKQIEESDVHLKINLFNFGHTDLRIFNLIK